MRFRINKQDLIKIEGNAHPVIDISRGISKDCGKVLDDNMRNASRGTPWSETYDMIYSAVDKFIEEINASPISEDIQ